MAMNLAGWCKRFLTFQLLSFLPGSEPTCRKSRAYDRKRAIVGLVKGGWGSRPSCRFGDRESAQAQIVVFKRFGSDLPHAAVNVQFDSGDVRSVGGSKECDGASDFFCLTETL